MRFLSLTVGAALSALPALTLAKAAPGPLVLRAINIFDFESAQGLQRRSTEDFSHLDLQTQSQLIYGSPGDQGQLLLANMTLYAPDGLQMIMMERFEGLTSSVDCSGDKGSMSLTFKSEAAFSYAVQQWNYINSAPSKKFLLIANHDGCSPADERQPYYITDLVEDQKTLTTRLTSKHAPWSDVAGTYEMDFGKVIPYKSPGQKRDLIGDIGNGISSIGSGLGGALSGTLDHSSTITFDIGAGTPNKVTNIFTDPDIKQRVKIDCVNCYISGAFELTGHVSVSLFSLKALTLQGKPKNLGAVLELSTTVAAVEKIDALSYTKELFAAGIPGAGIAITGIFHLGTTLSYEVGVSTSVKGTAAFTYGLSAGVPNTAQITADLANPDSSSASGFEGGNITPNFDVTALSASITAAAFTQPKLAFGVELTGVGTFDVNMVLKLPQVNAVLTAAYNESGLCSQTPGSSKTGVQLTSTLAIEVDLNLDATLGSNKKPTFTKKLFSILSLPLFSKCFPIDIPGLGPVGGTTKSTLPVPTTTANLTSITNKPTIPGTGSVSVPTVVPITNSTFSFHTSGTGVRKSTWGSGTGTGKPTGTGKHTHTKTTATGSTSSPIYGTIKKRGPLPTPDSYAVRRVERVRRALHGGW